MGIQQFELLDNHKWKRLPYKQQVDEPVGKILSKAECLIAVNCTIQLLPRLSDPTRFEPSLILMALALLPLVAYDLAL